MTENELYNKIVSTIISNDPSISRVHIVGAEKIECPITLGVFSLMDINIMRRILGELEEVIEVRSLSNEAVMLYISPEAGAKTYLKALLLGEVGFYDYKYET